MAKTTYTDGALSIDYELGITHVDSTKPKTDDIVSSFQQLFQPNTPVIVCLSGGLDSQFTAHMAKKTGLDVELITFKFYWEGSVINAYDVTTACDFANKIDLPHRLIDIDVKSILEKELINFAKEFKVDSPQIAVQLYAIKGLGNDRPILMGGHTPPIVVHDRQIINVMDSDLAYDKTLISYSPHKFMKLQGPFVLLNEKYNYNVMFDPFLTSPEMFYLSLLQVGKVFAEYKKFMPANSGLKSSPWEFKKAYYASFGFDYLMPLRKQTGFELLKTHLAANSGVYNKFDLLFRQPLERLATAEKWFGYHGNTSTRCHFTGDAYIDALSQLSQVFNDTEPKDCSIYNLDW